MEKIKAFIKKEVVLCVAAVLAVVSMFVVPPSLAYIDYIDFKTLVLLFCLMTVVAGWQKAGIFDMLAVKLLGGIKGIRMLVTVLVMMCFLSSMFITNDVALITFVPFTILMLSMAGRNDLLIFTVVMQTIAANLGSMLLPVGNPQNLYLYGASGQSFFEFTMDMLPLWLVSLVLILISMLFVKNDKLDSGIEKSLVSKKKKVSDIDDTAKTTIKSITKSTVSESNDNVIKNNSSQAVDGMENKKYDGKKGIIYAILFIICLGTVARLIPYQAVFVVVLLVVLVCDKELLKQVDYMLLLTFISFFIFIGNVKAVPQLTELLGGIIKGNELTAGILSSQVISNVPAAILLSGFSDNLKYLLWGVDIGGLGTLIASLASLISYKIYMKTEVADGKKYFWRFTLVNVIYLGVLWGMAMVML